MLLYQIEALGAAATRFKLVRRSILPRGGSAADTSTFQAEYVNFLYGGEKSMGWKVPFFGNFQPKKGKTSSPLRADLMRG